jgi:hypothetical protein
MRYVGDQISLLEKLLNKIKINLQTDCWEWQAATNNVGYGFIRDGNKMRTAHRVSYEQHVGPIPLGKIVCHTCDNPKCINPAHLWLGTMKDNLMDMIKKGRANYRTKGTINEVKRISCEHCGKTDIAVNVYGRCHGDKCKDKPGEINNTSTESSIK